VLTAGRGFFVALQKRLMQGGPARVFGNGSRCAKAIGQFRAPVRLGASYRLGGPRSVNWHVVRDLKLLPGSDSRPPYRGGPGNQLQRAFGRNATKATTPVSPMSISAMTCGSVTRDDDGRLHHPPPKVDSGIPTAAARRYLFARQLRCRRFRKIPFRFRSYRLGVQHDRNAVPPTFAERLGDALPKPFVSI